MSNQAQSGTRKKYTWEEVTRSPRGHFLAGDREFVDQDFTRAERRDLLAALPENGGLIELAVAVLNARKPDPLHRDVTAEWIDEQFSDASFARLMERLAALLPIDLNGAG